VSGYEGAGEYIVELNYDIDLDHVVGVIMASTYCQQHLRWDCKEALIHHPIYPDMTITFWNNRDGEPMLYFPGGRPGSRNCACAETRTCASTNMPCNCDINDNEWRFDEGFVTKLEDLPITSFSAGDTGR
jgi:hypothetical protein